MYFKKNFLEESYYKRVSVFWLPFVLNNVIVLYADEHHLFHLISIKIMIM